MSGYFSGTNVQADAMQTLYLMDPSYSAFNDSSNNSNMVLINPNTGAENQGNRFDIVGHRQQQHTGLSTLGSSGIAQQSHVVSLSNSGMSHQNPSLSVFTGRVNEAGYSWNGGNEFSFLPSSDMAEDNQSLAARLGVVTAVHQPGNDVNHYGVRGLSHPSIQEQGSLIPSGVALDVESLQASSGAGQILSLSLSPQQSAVAHLQSLPMQHHEPAVNDSPGFSNVGTNNIITKGESFINKCVGDGLNAFRSSPSGNLLGTGLQNQLSAVSHRQLNMVSSASTLELYSSKYLKAAQQLLNEVVSVGRGIKQRSLNQSKIASWMEPGSASEGFPAKDKNLPETSGKDGVTVSWSSTKDGPTAVSSMAAGSSGHTEPHAENAVELTLAERQELQMKKTKLMAMLDEVDRRYRQYYHQMQIVVGSFESAAGLGAARTYTALALQTISKHFRCLKDAIRGQIRATCKSLGEEDALGQGRGERSRLRFIDQQLRQQRAFQQLGMMQQPAWRPQRGLPERSVSILRAWLFEHFLHPYPKDSDKHLLASQTGLTRNQVSNWFINARVRLWKPMVEEMYAEEIKDGDGEDLDKVADGEDDMSKGSSLKDITGNSEASKGTQQANMQDAHLEQYSDPQLLSEHSSDMLHNRNLTSNLAESFSFQEKESTSQGMKRARNDTQDSISVLSSYSSGGMEFKPGEEIQDMKVRMDNRHMENYSMPHNALSQVNHQSFGGYGSLHLNGLSRYPQEGLAGSYTANSGVSLTLGLQHSDGLSLTGAQQHYMQGQGQVQMVRREEGAVAPASFYAMNESNAAGHNNIYAALDSKRYGAHLLHDLG